MSRHEHASNHNILAQTAVEHFVIQERYALDAQILKTLLSRGALFVKGPTANRMNESLH